MVLQQKKSRGAPTMEDVAQLAGVSHQTVSRVLNGHPNVSSKARDRVSTAIAELGYRRNASARSLVTRSSRTIGVVCLEMGQYGPANTLLGLQEAAYGEGYFVTVAGLRVLSESALREALDHLLDQPLDGIIVVAPLDAAVKMVRRLELPVPLVVVEATGNAERGTVAVDQQRGARMAVRHLIDAGHRRIAHLAGPQEWLDAQQRLAGWRAELAESGLPHITPMEGNWTAESGYKNGLAFADTRQATAVFVANDQMALGFMRALQERGLKVPEDVSVVGFDDQPEAAYFLPPLTSIRQDFQGLGRRCMQLLLSIIEERPFQASAFVAPELVVRASSAPLPSTDAASAAGRNASSALT